MSEFELYVIFLVPNELGFFCGSPGKLKNLKDSEEGRNIRFVSSDLHRQYFPLADDFGPVNLGVVHRFCSAFSKRLSKADGRPLVYCFEEKAEAQANASFLLCCLLLFYYGWTSEEAADAFNGPRGHFTLIPFRDATFSPDPYPLCLGDCLNGLTKAVQLQWFDWRTFDAEQYEYLDSPYNGDMHRICPKFVAFKGPLSDGSPYRLRSEIAFPPEHYAPLLLGLGVSCVVRLNDADTYDAGELQRAGVAHHDLPFPDCSVPPDEVVTRFLDLCDAAPGAVAVHCRAGLGRTGTLIALWMMRHAGFGADDAMGWLRIVRPGSGPGRGPGFPGCSTGPVLSGPSRPPWRRFAARVGFHHAFHSTPQD